MNKPHQRPSLASLQSGLGLSLGLLAALALILPLSAAAAPPAGASPVELQVLENTPARVVLDYAFGDYVLGSVDIGGHRYATLRLPGEPVIVQAGVPALPLACRSVIIPEGVQMTVNVLSAEYHEVSLDVVSSKGSIPRSIDPATVPYTFGEVYQVDAFWPGPLAELSGAYVLRDYCGVTVRVYPFQYNPVTSTLRVYTHLQVEVVPAAGPDSVHALSINPKKKVLSRAFHEIYTSHFSNYNPGLRYTPLDEDGDMLIICHDPWIPNVQPLVDHKNAIGIDTTIVGVSTIPGGNTASAIASYIQTVYNTSDLAFVLLVGDIAQIDSPVGVSGGATDPAYALLYGGDTYPDIIVGRFSAQNTDQVDTQVERTIEYEQMPATEQDWFWKGTGVASNLGVGDDGEYDNEHIENIRVDLLAYGYTEVDQIYDPGATDTQVTNALNAGRGIVNYCGHGGPTSWTTTGFNNTDINNLVNDNMLPFIVTVACDNGEFDVYDTCFAEAWLRATHDGEPTGAVGCYASSISQPWSPPMEGQDEFNLLYVAEAYSSYGAYCFAGSCSMMDDYPGSIDVWGNGVATFVTWHIFGDPSLCITGTVGAPHGMKVAPSDGLDAAGPWGGPFTPDSIQYTVENVDPNASLSYEVTKTQPWLTISNASGTIGPQDSVVVTVSINANANTLDNGEHSDTVQFVNTTDHVGDTTRDVSLTIGVPARMFQWAMDNDPGWTTEGLWAWGQPTGGGGEHGYPDPDSGRTGDYVYGYNLDGDYENYLVETHLTSTPLDCSNLTRVSLKFWRWLGVEVFLRDHAYVRVSNDGTNWTTIWENELEVADSSWTLQEFDISALADHQPTVYLRWTMGRTDATWQYCGWNIDDVEIWGLPPGGPSYSLGDLNCDGSINGLDIDPFVLALGSTPPDYPEYYAQHENCDVMLADCNSDSSINGLDIDPFVDLLQGK